MMDECDNVESQMQVCEPENNQQDEAAMTGDRDSLRSDAEERITDSQRMALEKAIIRHLTNGPGDKATESKPSSLRRIPLSGENLATAMDNDREIGSPQVLQQQRPTRSLVVKEAAPTKERTTFTCRTPETSVASSLEETDEERNEPGEVSKVVTTAAAAGLRTVRSKNGVRTTCTKELQEFGAFHEAPGLQSRRSEAFSRSHFHRSSFAAVDAAPPPLLPITPTTSTADDYKVVEANRVEDVVEVEAKPIEWWTPKVVFSLVLIVLFILSVVTGTTVAVTRDKSSYLRTIPTASPTFSPESRKTKIMDILLDAYCSQIDSTDSSQSSIIETLFDNPESPQAKALQWLAIDDDYRVSVRDRKHILQRYILAVLYYATGGDQWTDSYEFLAPSHECSWSGALRCFVTMEGHHEHLPGQHCILGINLRDNNLVGMLPAELGMLSSLKSVIVDSNALSGTLPESLQDLRALTDLTIHQNDFDGPIPSEIFTLLTDLQVFMAQENKFTGTIPSEIGSASLMSKLCLQDNFLNGTIPDSLWDLTNMEVLDIGAQSLSGTISPNVGQWSNITTLHMSKLNGVTGRIPTQMGLLTNLASLKLSQNHMSGSLPTELGQLTKLTRLALSRNGFNGTVPQEFVRLTDLKELYVQNTWVSGDMNFVCDAVEDGELSDLNIINADMNEVNCTCCSCCLY